MSRVTRIIEMREVLLAGEVMQNASAWAKRFGVDVRTIQRDISYLKNVEGLDIEYTATRGGYCCRFTRGFSVSGLKKKKWGRLMALIHRIAAEPGKSSQQLAREMKCSNRTIFRDLEELQEIGFPIYFDNGYRFAADSFLPTLSLSPSELLAIFLGARMLEGLNADVLAPTARTALEKLVRAVSEERRLDIGHLREAVAVASPLEDTGIDKLMGLQFALGAERRIRMRYQGLHDPRAKEREVDPVGLFCFRQVWYLRAFDIKRSDYRSFRLSRIESWEETAEPVSPNHKMELSEATYNRWDSGDDEVYEVELRVTDSLKRWLLENPQHPSQRVEGDRVYYLARDLDSVSRWVAGLYGLEVLGPELLRTRMREIAGSLQALYGGGSSGVLSSELSLSRSVTI